MYYVIWVIGVLFAVWLGVKVATTLDKKGKFDE